MTMSHTVANPATEGTLASLRQDLRAMAHDLAEGITYPGWVAEPTTDGGYSLVSEHYVDRLSVGALGTLSVIQEVDVGYRKITRQFDVAEVQPVPTLSIHDITYANGFKRNSTYNSAELDEPSAVGLLRTITAIRDGRATGLPPHQRNGIPS